MITSRFVRFFACACLVALGGCELAFPVNEVDDAQADTAPSDATSMDAGDASDAYIQPDCTNLIANGSFELASGVTCGPGWSSQAGAALSPSTKDPSGSGLSCSICSSGLTRPGIYQAPIGDGGIWIQNVVASVSFLVEGAPKAAYYVAYSEPDGATNSYNSGDVFPSSQWQVLPLVKSSATLIRLDKIVVYVAGDGGCTLADDVSLCAQ